MAYPLAIGLSGWELTGVKGIKMIMRRQCQLQQKKDLLFQQVIRYSKEAGAAGWGRGRPC